MSMVKYITAMTSLHGCLDETRKNTGLRLFFRWGPCCCYHYSSTVLWIRLVTYNTLEGLDQRRKVDIVIPIAI